jgi:hypothetical protein
MKCKKCEHELQPREGYITNHEQTIWYCPKCRERNYFKEQSASEHSELSVGLAAHVNLGRVKITDACMALQKANPDSTSCFVEHEGEIKEVSRLMVGMCQMD